MIIDVPPRRRHVISLTPLIDVVFILLVFFMLASSFVEWRGMDLALSGSGIPSSENPAILRLRADGGMQLNGQPILSDDQLLGQLSAGSAVSVVVEPGVPVQASVDVMALLQGAGLQRIGLRAAGTP